MSAESDLPLCKYGAKCYRKNENHLNKFSHKFEIKKDDVTSSFDKKESEDPRKPQTNPVGTAKGADNKKQVEYNNFTTKYNYLRIFLSAVDHSFFW